MRQPLFDNRHKEANRQPDAQWRSVREDQIAGDQCFADRGRGFGRSFGRAHGGKNQSRDSAASKQIGPVGGRLMPVVEIAGREFVLLMPSITNVPVSELGAPVGDVEAFRDKIVDAIDGMFLGI